LRVGCHGDPAAVVDHRHLETGQAPDFERKAGIQTAGEQQPTDRAAVRWAADGRCRQPVDPVAQGRQAVELIGAGFDGALADQIGLQRGGSADYRSPRCRQEPAVERATLDKEVEDVPSHEVEVTLLDEALQGRPAGIAGRQRTQFGLLACQDGRSRIGGPRRPRVGIGGQGRPQAQVGQPADEHRRHDGGYQQGGHQQAVVRKGHPPRGRLG